MGKTLTPYHNPEISINTSSKMPQEQLFDQIQTQNNNTENIINITEGHSVVNISDI